MLFDRAETWYYEIFFSDLKLLNPFGSYGQKKRKIFTFFESTGFWSLFWSKTQ